MALRVSELCFWPAKTRKNIELFVMHTYLWPGAQIWFRHKWRKLVAASLLLHCIDWYSHFRYSKEFFLTYVSGFRWMFSRIALWWKRLQMDSKSDLATNGLILDFFCLKMASFVDFLSVSIKICKNCSIINRFWGHQIFSMFSLGGILVCSLKMLVLFSHKIL